MSTASTQTRSIRLFEIFRDGLAALIPNVTRGAKSSGFSGTARQEITASSVEGCLFCLDRSADQNEIMLESSAFFVRYDNFPASPGHIEIVPKRHVESFFELSPKEVTEAYTLMCEAKDELTKKHHPDGYTIGINEGDASGRSVKHLHIHLIPRHHGDVEDPRGGIRQVVPNWQPDLWRQSVDSLAKRGL